LEPHPTNPDFIIIGDSTVWRIVNINTCKVHSTTDLTKVSKDPSNKLACYNLSGNGTLMATGFGKEVLIFELKDDNYLLKHSFTPPVSADITAIEFLSDSEIIFAANGR